MIQYYLDLEQEIQNIKEKRLSSGQIQKLYSTAYYISLSIRAPGKTWHVFLGRGSGHEGVWLHDAAPPAMLRRKDTFLEYLRRHITSCSFLDISLDKSDRIARLDYQKFGEKQSFCFFWKGRKLYFLHYYQDQPGTPFKLLLSWKGKAFVPGVELLDLFEYFDEIGRHHDMDHDLRSPHPMSMQDLILEEQRLAELKSTTSIPHFLKRKKENIENDLRKTRQWEKLQNILDHGETLDHLYELKVEDQKIKFEGELNPYERRNLLYQKIKKLKKGEAILSNRLEEVKEQLADSDKIERKQSVTQMIRPVWGEEKAPAFIKPAQTKDEYRILKLDDCQIGVGLNAQGNDQLRSKWASKEDTWFHLDGQKSCHVIIKLNRAGALSPDLINLGASIVAQFSHFNDEWIPIIYTQVKNLKGVSGSAGMVIYKKEKHLRCPRVSLEHILKD